MNYHTYVKVRETIHESQKTDKTENLMQYCRQNRHIFVDKQFQPNKGSLAGNPVHHEYKNQFDQLRWLRPKDIFKNQPYTLFADVNPNDILQGSLGDCYFLCALASLAEHPDLITRLFDFDAINEHGVHSIWLNINGAWKNYLLDEYLPCSSGSGQNSLAFSKTTQNELWVLMLEKAYAKAYGSYWDIVGGDPAVALRDLTGAPFERISDFKNVEEAWGKIKTANAQNFVLTCFTKSTQIQEEKNTIGIVSGHAYSLLDVQDVIDSRRRPAKLLQIRNPWGKFEWKGDFNDNCQLWTPELKQRLNIQQLDDGFFCMKLEDFATYFEEIGVLKIIPNFISNSVLVKQKDSNFSIIRIVLTQKTKITISIDQVDSRLVDDPNYNYSFMRCVLGHLVKKDGIEFVDAAFAPEKSVFIEGEYEAGDYVLLVEGYWSYKKLSECVVGTYSDNPVEMELLPQNTQLYKSAEYFIWKNFARQNKSIMSARNKTPVSSAGESFEIQHYVHQNPKHGMILYAYWSTSTKVAVHQTYKLNNTGLDALGKNATNSQAEIIVNPQDCDIVLLKMDFRVPKVTMSYSFCDQEVIPYKFSDDTSMLEMLRLMGGNQPTYENPNAKVISRADKLKDAELRVNKKSQLENLRNQRQEELFKQQETIKNNSNKMERRSRINEDKRNDKGYRDYYHDRPSGFFERTPGPGPAPAPAPVPHQNGKQENCVIF